MKKRIFIAMHYLEIGGAETALIGLLQTLDYSRYDVDLFLYAHRGEMMQYVPKEVNLLPEIPIYAQIERPMKSVLLDGYVRMVLTRLKGKIQTWNYMRHHTGKESAAGLQYVADSVTPLLSDINPTVEYDLAISFLQPHNIVRDKVRAKKKICWIHTDYSIVDVNVKNELPVWSAFDHVISISDDVTKTFLQTFPSLENKIVMMENILSPKFVRSRAEEFDVNLNENGKGLTLTLPSREGDDKGNGGKVIKLLSVGRFCEAKNYDNVPDICRRINSSLLTSHFSLKVRWFLIGYGGDEDLIRQKIKEAGMEDHVIILGKKSNPYPYIKACDIYVQPSRYEGKSVTVREAQMLCKPVVVTNYPTASSQIKDGIDGVIVPLDNERCAKGLAEFILNDSLQKSIRDYLVTHDYGNMEEVKKIDLLF